MNYLFCHKMRASEVIGMYEKQLKDYIERRNAGIIHEEFNVLTQEEGELEERKHLLNRKRGILVYGFYITKASDI